MPFIPTPGTYFERFSMVSREALTRIRNRMERILPQMRHCQQCRADAVGTVLDERPLSFGAPAGSLQPPKCSPSGAVPVPGEETFRFAVASGSGYLVDLHFGHAKELLIYSASRSGVRFLERREIGPYCSGSDECDSVQERIAPVLRAVSDCRAILVMRIGDAPRRALAEKGIHVSMTCDRVEVAIRECLEVLLGPVEVGSRPVEGVAVPAVETAPTFTKPAFAGSGMPGSRIGSFVAPHSSVEPGGS